MRRVLAVSAAAVALAATGCGSSKDKSAETFCKVKLHATRAQLADAMGKPTTRYPNQDQWNRGKHAFLAFYDARNRAYILQVSQGSSPCDPLRRALTP